MDKVLIINAIKEHYNFKKDSDFAEFLGIKQNTLSGWKSRNTLDYDKIISKCDSINANWLLTGKGEMLLENVKTIKNNMPTLDQAQPLANNEAQLTNTLLKKVIKIPIHAHAGFLHNYGDIEFLEQLPVEYWEVDQEYKGDYLVFEVKGDSMDNNTDESIKENDRLLCREVPQHYWQYKLHINKWDFVIAHKDEGILVKRIIDHNETSGEITCHSLNSYYEDFTINLNDVLMIYNVVDLKRNRRR